MQVDDTLYLFTYWSCWLVSPIDLFYLCTKITTPFSFLFYITISYCQYDTIILPCKVALCITSKYPLPTIIYNSFLLRIGASFRQSILKVRNIDASQEGYQPVKVNQVKTLSTATTKDIALSSKPLCNLSITSKTAPNPRPYFVTRPYFVNLPSVQPSL